MKYVLIIMLVAFVIVFTSNTIIQIIRRRKNDNDITEEVNSDKILNKGDKNK